MLRADAGDRTIAGRISNIRTSHTLPELLSEAIRDSYFYLSKIVIRSDIKRTPHEKISAYARSGTVSLSVQRFVESNYLVSDAECTIARPAPSATRPPVRSDESGNDSDPDNFTASTIQAASLTAWSVCWLRLISLALALVCRVSGLRSYRSCKIPMGGLGLTALQPVPAMIQGIREWGVGRDTSCVSLYRQHGWSHSATRR